MDAFLEEQLGKAIRAAEHQFLGRERRFLSGLRIDRLQDSQLWLLAKETPPAPRTIDRVCRIIGEKLRESLQVEIDLHVTLARKSEQRSVEREPLVDASNLEATLALEALAQARLCAGPHVYLYGRSGVGKSHWLTWFQQRVEVPCVRWNALELHREVQMARKLRRLTKLREVLRASEILIIDEVHRLRSKRRTQDELVQILDELAARQRRIVLAGRHHPRQIHEFSTPLASRLLGGYVIELHTPLPATRLEFAERIWNDAHSAGGQYGAGRRAAREEKELFLSLMRGMQSYAAIEQRAVEFFESASPQARTANDGLAVPEAGAGRAAGGARERDKGAIFEDLLACVARYFELDIEELRARTASRRVALPRQTVAYLASRSGVPGPELARRLGWRSASSVTYAMRRVLARMESDREYRRFIESCL